MSKELEGQKIAILAADGVERIELEEPRGAPRAAGAQTDVISIHDGETNQFSGGGGEAFEDGLGNIDHSAGTQKAKA